MSKNFPYIVRPTNKDESGVNYIIEYIDFPGITGGANTLIEAIQMAEDALNMYFEVLLKEKKLIPNPKELSATGRITLRLPKSTHIRVVEMANREGISLNTYILDAILYKLYSNIRND